MSRVPRFLLFVLIGCGLTFAQNSQPNISDGLEILKRASQQYADAKTYDIQAIEEDNFGNELQRQWQKTLLEAAEVPGGRFHYEGHSGFGSELQVSDGTNVWTYDVDGHAFTKKSVAAPPAMSIIGITEGQTVQRAKGLRRELAELARHYKSAARLPDAVIDRNGKPFACYVVQVTHLDSKRSNDDTFQETIWIDQSSNTFLKRSSHAQSWLLANNNRIPQTRDITITYTAAVLGGTLPESLFSFDAPTDAKLLDEFPNPFENNGAPSLQGQSLPELKLVTSKGENISRSSLSGKVVILDIWATWCAPCVTGLEALSEIYGEGRDKGLMLITIDQDEEAATAEAMLSKKGYVWINVHDPGEIVKALGGTNGIPRTIVVNREGKVIYDRTAGTEAELRKAIVAAGPEFVSLAPKPQRQPCGTQASAKVN